MAHIRPETVTEIRIGSGECNSEKYTVLDLSKFKNLKTVVIGDGSYRRVNEVKLTGLNELESVVIGDNSFSGEVGTFVLKNCPLVKELSIGSKSLTYFKELQLENVPALESLKIGDDLLMAVKEVKLIGLRGLKSVEIGMNSFTYHKNSYGNDPNRHFYLKNCPKLKSLKIGRYSFSDYKVCEIENVDALEVIEMGDLNEESHNFVYASLELKSILIHNE